MIEAIKEMNWNVKEQESSIALKEMYEIPYFIFEHLENTGMVVQGFSTRMGGVSTGDCATMNLSFERGDSEEAVRTNYELLGAAVGFRTDSISQMNPLLLSVSLISFQVPLLLISHLFSSC